MTSISPRFHTVAEVAEHFRVPVKTVYTWTSERRIGFTKPGKALRFTDEDIATFEAANRFEPLRARIEVH